MEPLQQLFVDAITLARARQQCVGSRQDYYITIEQLEALIQKQNQT